MTKVPPEIAALNKASSDSEVVAAIHSVLKNCAQLLNVSRYRAMETQQYRNFLIDVTDLLTVRKVIDLLGGQSEKCRSYATNSVLLKIYNEP